MKYTKPYPYQKESYPIIYKHKGRVLLADEMGLGKSYQAYLWARRNPESRPMIIVCPAGLKINWAREAAQHFGLTTEILWGTKASDPPLIRPKHSIIIINYEILVPWLPFLRSIKPKLVVGDEAHYLCNRNSKRSKAFRALVKRVPEIILATGTPLTNQPAELWNLLNILWPARYPAFFPFAQKYCQPRFTPWGWQYRGARHLPELHSRLKHDGMIRRTKKEVLKDLPPNRSIVVPMDIKRRHEYREAQRDFIKWLSKKSRHKAIKALKAERFVKGGYLLRLAAKLKIDYVLEWVANFLQETDEKLILVAVHKSFIKQVKDKFNEVSTVIDGSVTGYKRQRAIDAFQKNPRTRMMIMNIHAGGVGINLTAGTTGAFAEFGLTSAAHEQAMARNNRIGQKFATRWYWFVASGTIEEKLVKILQTKKGVLDSTLDGRKTKDMNVFDMLEKALLSDERKTR